MNGNITANTALVSNDINSRIITATNNLFTNTTTGAINIGTALSGVGSITLGNLATEANNRLYGTISNANFASTVASSTTNLNIEKYVTFVGNNSGQPVVPTTTLGITANPFFQRLTATTMRCLAVDLNNGLFIKSPNPANYNISFGDSLNMYNATTGSQYNISLGYNASNALTSATDNVSIGKDTLALNQTGFCNIAVGNGALGNISTQGGNVALGYQSNNINTVANNTVSIGIFTSATSDDSIAIGSNASASYSNSVAIGLNSSTTATNQIQLGTSTHSLNCDANSINLGLTTSTGNFSYNGAQTTGTNNLFSNATTSNIAIGAALTSGTLTIGRLAETGTVTYYGARTTGSSNLFTNTTTGQILIGTSLTSGSLSIATNITTGTISVGKLGSNMAINSTINSPLNLSSSITQTNQTIQSAVTQIGYTLKGTLATPAGPLNLTGGQLWSSGIFAAAGGVYNPSSSNFGVYYIQVSVSINPQTNTYGLISLSGGTGVDYNNAVSYNYNMRDTSYVNVQVSNMFSIFSTTSYVYFVINNINTGTASAVSFRNIQYTITRIA